MLKKNQLPDLGLYKLKREDLNRAEEMLTDAFFEDPGVLFIMDSNVYDKNKAKHLHRFNLEYGMRYGEVYATSKNLEGIAIWLPPDEIRMSAWKAIRSGGLTLKKKTHKNILKVFRTYDRLSSELHKRYASFPHWYLMELAVDKGHQGKHMASVLLDPFFNYFDKYGYPCYIETHKSINVEVYEHYGFRIKEICTLPGTNKQHWAMVRMPQGKILALS